MLRVLLIAVVFSFILNSLAKAITSPADSAINEMADYVRQRIDQVKTIDSKLEDASLANASEQQIAGLNRQRDNAIADYLHTLKLYKDMAKKNGLDLENSRNNLIRQTEDAIREMEVSVKKCKVEDLSRLKFEPSIKDGTNIELNTQSDCPGGCYLSFDKINRNSDGEAMANYQTTNWRTPSRYWSKLKKNGQDHLAIANAPNDELMILFNPRLCCQLDKSTCKRSNEVIVWDFKKKRTQVYSDFKDFNKKYGNKKSGHSLYCKSEETTPTICSLDNVDITDSHTDKNKLIFEGKSSVSGARNAK